MTKIKNKLNKYQFLRNKYKKHCPKNKSKRKEKINEKDIK